MRKYSERGFTLIEVIVSMAIFSMMLLIVAAGVVGLLHIYEAGVQIRSTQKNARIVTQAISKDLHTAQAVSMNSVVTSGYHQDRLCLFSKINSSGVGEGAVYYVTGGTTSGQIHRKAFSGMANTVCVSSGALPLKFGADQILGDNTVSVVKLQVNPGPHTAYVSSDLSFAPVNAISGGLVDFSSPPTVRCDDAQRGSQFCAISNVSVGGSTHTETED